MAGTSRGGKKAADKLRAKDPDYFSHLARRSRKPRGGKASPGSFKKGNPFAAKGGKAGKRGAVKLDRQIPSSEADEAFPLEYEVVKA
jgi:hypothetical protein